MILGVFVNSKLKMINFGSLIPLISLYFTYKVPLRCAYFELCQLILLLGIPLFSKIVQHSTISKHSANSKHSAKKGSASCERIADFSFD